MRQFGLALRMLAIAGLFVSLRGESRGQGRKEGLGFTSLDQCSAARQTVHRNPESQMADLYKFAHQGAFGPAHAAHDREQARSWMEREIAELSDPDSGPAPAAEPLWEPLTSQGTLVRVNLRPWLLVGFDSEVLLEAFVRTASEHSGSAEELLRTWSCFEALASEGELQANRTELRAYLHEQQAAGWPPVHHSEIYVKEYVPAYRVVRRSYLAKAFRGKER